MANSNSKCRLLNGYYQLYPFSSSSFIHSETLSPLQNLYRYFPKRESNYFHNDALVPSHKIANDALVKHADDYTIGHICLIHTTYRRSILNHIPFWKYLEIYTQIVKEICVFIDSLGIEYILFSDHAHHLEQIVLLSAASHIGVKCFCITGTGVSLFTGFLYETNADCGIVRILKTNKVSVDWSNKKIQSPISLDKPEKDFNLKNLYGLGFKEEEKNAIRERNSKLNNYIMYGKEAREYKQFCLYRDYQSRCNLDYDMLVSEPFILFLLHYEPEAVVDHFSFSNDGQINAILEACSHLKDRGIRFLVKEHPVTFSHSFSNGENHIPLFRNTADYDRLLEAGIYFVNNKFKCDNFLSESSLICVSSIASTALYEAQLKSKFIYPLGTSIYNMSKYSLDETCFKCLPDYKLDKNRESSMDNYLVPNLYLGQNIDDKPREIISSWIDLLDKIILNN